MENFFACGGRLCFSRGLLWKWKSLRSEKNHCVIASALDPEIFLWTLLFLLFLPSSRPRFCFFVFAFFWCCYFSFPFSVFVFSFCPWILDLETNPEKFEILIKGSNFSRWPGCDPRYAWKNVWASWILDLETNLEKFKILIKFLNFWRSWKSKPNTYPKKTDASIQDKPWSVHASEFQARALKYSRQERTSNGGLRGGHGD